MYHMFADDVQLFHSFAEMEISDAFTKIRTDIAAVCSWAKENGLLLNANKTQAIFFSNNAVRAVMPDIYIDGTLVKYSDTSATLELR